MPNEEKTEDAELEDEKCSLDLIVYFLSDAQQTLGALTAQDSPLTERRHKRGYHFLESKDGGLRNLIYYQCDTGLIDKDLHYQAQKFLGFNPDSPKACLEVITRTDVIDPNETLSFKALVDYLISNKIAFYVMKDDALQQFSVGGYNPATGEIKRAEESKNVLSQLF